MDPRGAINVHRDLNISAYFSPPVLIFRNIWTGGLKYMYRGVFFRGGQICHHIPVYTFVADPKNLRWEVYKPLTTKNLHYPVTVNNEDELFTTQQSHMELLYYPNTHYDSIVDCNTELCSTTKPQIKSFTDTTSQAHVIEL